MRLLGRSLGGVYDRWGWMVTALMGVGAFLCCRWPSFYVVSSVEFPEPLPVCGLAKSWAVELLDFGVMALGIGTCCVCCLLFRSTLCHFGFAGCCDVQKSDFWCW